jgi:hypothetical protein
MDADSQGYNIMVTGANNDSRVRHYVQHDHRLRVCRILDSLINLLAMSGIVDPSGV